MTPVDQTRFGVGQGNCYPACLASLLNLRLDQVPDVMAADDWWEQLCGWARELGWNLLSLDWPGASYFLPERGYAIAGGLCERGGRHSCVYRDGRLAWDPHPSRAGLLSVDTWTLLVPLDPGVWHR